MKLVVLASLLLPSAVAFAGPPLAGARVPTVLAIPHVPSRAMCNGGRFRCYARAQLDAAGRVRADATPAGLGATDLEDAYHLDTSKDPGATVAVIDAYGYATLEADLAVYRSTYGLPPCTVASGCLQIVNQQGQTSPLPGPPPTGDDWTVETALDLDMASAGCPTCKLIVVEADDDRGDGLLVANDAAAMLGATVVSNSWGSPEPSGSTLVDEETHLTHPGIAFFASTGDNGYEGTRFASFPATSSHVIAVGGTALLRAPGPRGWAESAWTQAGSACSNSVAKPSWQPSAGCGFRVTADVSAVGDPSTGPAVYADGSWGVVGGTSASSPFVAATFALTGHGDATPQLPYQHPEMFNDVTSGTNGSCGTVLCDAGTGWDGPTGLGTPNGAALAGAKAPTLAVTPATGAIVPVGFTLNVTCTSNDAATIMQVQVTVDGETFAPLTAAPYAFPVPTSFVKGMHHVSVTCTTSSIVTVQQDLTVDLVDHCDTDADCAAGDVCFDNGCLAGQGAAGGLGETCSGNSDCMTGTCASDGTNAYCTLTCDAQGACPTGFSCLTGGGAPVCWPASGGGGCDARADRGPPPAGIAGLVLLLLVALVPRRRRAA